MNIEIEKKPTIKSEQIKITGTKCIAELKEVKEIKDVVQEHLLFIGLDRSNNVRNINLIGIGNSRGINIDSKDIVRKALMTASDRVVLVHNHPSNSTKPSLEDKHITNITSKLLEIFHIELVDHIIVTEKEYVSMMSLNAIEKNYKSEKIDFLEKALLVEENNKLKIELENSIPKKEIQNIINKLDNSKISNEQEDEEDLEL